jgi:uncharacterized protein YoxC
MPEVAEVVATPMEMLLVALVVVAMALVLLVLLVRGLQQAQKILAAVAAAGETRQIF